MGANSTALVAFSVVTSPHTAFQSLGLSEAASKNVDPYINFKDFLCK